MQNGCSRREWIQLSRTWCLWWTPSLFPEKRRPVISSSLATWQLPSADLFSVGSFCWSNPIMTPTTKGYPFHLHFFYWSIIPKWINLIFYLLLTCKVCSSTWDERGSKVAGPFANLYQNFESKRMRPFFANWIGFELIAEWAHQRRN